MKLYFLGVVVAVLSLAACSEASKPTSSKEEFVATAKMVADSASAGVFVVVVCSDGSNDVIMTTNT